MLPWCRECNSCRGGKKYNVLLFCLEGPPFPTLIPGTVLSSLGAHALVLCNYLVGLRVLFVIKMSGNLPVPQQFDPHWEFSEEWGLREDW